MNRLHILGAILLAAATFSCKGKGEEESAQLARDTYRTEKNRVDTIHLSKRAFSMETISNGILKGATKAELRFKGQGLVTSVAVHNGSRVRKGDVIARQESRALELEFERTAQSLEKARLDLYDALIGFGYGRDTANVPADILSVAKIRSGYAGALNSYKVAQLALENAVLVSPVDGVVANLAVKPHEYSPQTACVVIDDSAFEVEFKVLEGELQNIAVGREVEVIPFADPIQRYSGTIKEINPFVDDKGQIVVKASIKNKGGKLVEGMNVKVHVKSAVQYLHSVPKSAVVMRDGYDVLFVYNPNTGKAEWRYVDILQSNSTSHVVAANKAKNARLEEGEAVIVNGNLNLADGSDVEISEN